MLWSLWISETLPCIFYIKPLICLLSKSNKSFKWSLHNEIIIRLFVCRWIINQFNVKKKIKIQQRQMTNSMQEVINFNYTQSNDRNSSQVGNKIKQA